MLSNTDLRGDFTQGTGRAFLAEQTNRDWVSAQRGMERIARRGQGWMMEVLEGAPSSTRKLSQERGGPELEGR